MSKATRKPRFDFVSLGESMLRLSVPTGQRLDDTRWLDMELAGDESNVSVALMRLGWRTGWVSRMADDALQTQSFGRSRLVASPYWNLPLRVAAQLRLSLRLERLWVWAWDESGRRGGNG